MKTKPLKGSECGVTRSCDKITQVLIATMRKVMLKMFGECCLTMNFFLLKVVQGKSHGKHAMILTIFTQTQKYSFYCYL